MGDAATLLAVAAVAAIVAGGSVLRAWVLPPIVLLCVVGFWQAEQKRCRGCGS